MSTRVEDGVVQVLRTALKKIEEERAALNRIADEKRREFEEYVRRQHESLDRRREALTNAMEAMLAEAATTTLEAAGVTGAPPEEGARLAISDKNLNEIREYLKSRDGQARQQDVVNDTGLNSGVVSVGLRKLMTLGEIERAGKENGSQVWRTREPAMTGAGNFASIKPGVGVSQASRL